MNILKELLFEHFFLHEYCISFHSDIDCSACGLTDHDPAVVLLVSLVKDSLEHVCVELCEDIHSRQRTGGPGGSITCLASNPNCRATISKSLIDVPSTEVRHASRSSS